MTRTRESPTGAPTLTGKTRSDHVNQVLLTGSLTGPPEPRTLPNGDEVLSFRMTIRTPSAQSRTSRAALPVRGRNDNVDCVAVLPVVRSRLAHYGVGDIVRVQGSLRHRYWRSAGGVSSRYEVEAHSILLIKRQASPP